MFIIKNFLYFTILIFIKNYYNILINNFQYRFRNDNDSHKRIEIYIINILVKM